MSATDHSKPADATSRFGSYSDAVTAGVGYSAAERAERRAEIEGHLADMHARAVRSGIGSGEAVERVIAEFGDPAVLRRRLWWTRIVTDLRSAWRLSRLVFFIMLTDLVAATLWIGLDLASATTDAERYASMLVVFTFATTVLYWVAMSLGYGGVIVARRALKHRAPAVELVLACGLVGSAITVFFMLRPGAVANVIGSVMEAHPAWRSSWEWAGVVFPVLTLVGGALIVWRTRALS